MVLDLDRGYLERAKVNDLRSSRITGRCLKPKSPIALEAIQECNNGCGSPYTKREAQENPHNSVP